MKSKICIVGWHYFEKYYKQLSKSSLYFHVVAHRYNDILDKYKLPYSVIKNVGTEFHVYDWYIKNIWDGKSNVLFVHDDIGSKDIASSFKEILKKTKDFDFSCVFGEKDSKNKWSGERCFFLSSKLINLFLKKYGGIWYDIHNKGYTLGRKEMYDPEIYTYEYDNVFIDQEGRNIKVNLQKMEKEYNLKYKNIVCKTIILQRRGGVLKGKYRDIALNDNSIFGRNSSEKMGDIAFELGLKRGREQHYYTKWYDFYFSSIRLDNLSILEIGSSTEKSLLMWKKYFKHSDIYGLRFEKLKKNAKISNKFKVFTEEKFNKLSFNNIFKKVPTGFDIVIDDGSQAIAGQIETFEYLFKNLNPGGIYIIEDLHTSYKDKHVIKSEKSSIDYLKKRVDDVNYQGKSNINNFEKIIRNDMKLLEGYERTVMSIHFYPGICFIFKRFLK